MPSCSVCCHPELQRIDEALASGRESYRDLEKRFGVGRASLTRRRAHALKRSG
jgi:Trp operon repressor